MKCISPTTIPCSQCLYYTDCFSKKIIDNFQKKLLNNIENMPIEFSKKVDNHFWELLL